MTSGGAAAVPQDPSTDLTITVACDTSIVPASVLLASAPWHPAASQGPSLQVTALLLEPTWQQWAADTQAVTSALPGALDAPLQAAQQLLVTFERWLLQLKALRRMVMFGFPSDARSLVQVWQACCCWVGALRRQGLCLPCCIPASAACGL